MKTKNLLRPRFIIAETVVLIAGILLYTGDLSTTVGVGLLAGILAAFQAYSDTPTL